MRVYAITTEKRVKATRGRNAGKYKTVLENDSFAGSWDELIKHIEKNHLTLVGFDYVDLEQEGKL